MEMDCTETSINYVWLRMTWMEMDCNLFFLCIVEKTLKPDYSLLFLGEIT